MVLENHIFKIKVGAALGDVSQNDSIPVNGLLAINIRMYIQTTFRHFVETF